MERQDTASDERAGECTPKLLWLSLAANDAKSIDAMDRKWIGCEVRHKSRGKGAFSFEFAVHPCRSSAGFVVVSSTCRRSRERVRPKAFEDCACAVRDAS